MQASREDLHDLINSAVNLDNIVDYKILNKLLHNIVDLFGNVEIRNSGDRDDSVAAGCSWWSNKSNGEQAFASYAEKLEFQEERIKSLEETVKKLKNVPQNKEDLPAQASKVVASSSYPKLHENNKINPLEDPSKSLLDIDIEVLEQCAQGNENIAENNSSDGRNENILDNLNHISRSQSNLNEDNETLQQQIHNLHEILDTHLQIHSQENPVGTVSNDLNNYQLHNDKIDNMNILLEKQAQKIIVIDQEITKLKSLYEEVVKANSDTPTQPPTDSPSVLPSNTFTQPLTDLRPPSSNDTPPQLSNNFPIQSVIDLTIQSVTDSPILPSTVVPPAQSTNEIEISESPVNPVAQTNDQKFPAEYLISELKLLKRKLSEMEVKFLNLQNELTKIDSLEENLHSKILDEILENVIPKLMDTLEHQQNNIFDEKLGDFEQKLTMLDEKLEDHIMRLKMLLADQVIKLEGKINRGKINFEEKVSNEAAGGKNKVMGDLTCISCNRYVTMQLRESHCLSSVIAEPLPASSRRYPKKCFEGCPDGDSYSSFSKSLQKKSTGKRLAGGTHTIISARDVEQQIKLRNESSIKSTAMELICIDTDKNRGTQEKAARILGGGVTGVLAWKK